MPLVKESRPDPHAPTAAMRLVAALILAGAATVPGCQCYGGDPSDPTPPADDDTVPDGDDDDDITYTDNVQHYPVEGFFLEIGLGSGTTYAGLAVNAEGVVTEWSGIPGVHQDDRYRATLSHEQMYRIHGWLDEAGFFGMQSESVAGDVCALTHRYDVTSHRVDHAPGAAPAELADFYSALADFFEPYGIEPACGG
ncbi:MAG: hypothetical protein HUU15_05690 [Candidatus Brocadiae bacterium]|nr:hypothetical protein [Myxococcota bacterium]NUN48306.1 hypothetical protein [Candidatus Brocadiia bacterium]